MKNSIILYILLCSFTIGYSADWNTVDSTENAFMCNISCIDSLNCFYCFNRFNSEPYIKKTTDGGKTWNIVYMDTLVYEYRDEYGMPKNISHKPGVKIKKISTPTKDLCLILADSNFFYRSTDFGNSWNLIKPENMSYTGYGSMNIFFDLEMLDNYNGIFVDYSNVYTTSNGGLQWNKINFNIAIEPKTFEKTFMFSQFNYMIYGICENNKILNYYFITTSDGGISWNYFQLPHTFSNIFFINKDVGWASYSITDSSMKYSSVLMKTEDGGNSWIIQDTLENIHHVRITDIDFIDELNGVIISDNSETWITNTGGEDWVYMGEHKKNYGPVFQKDIEMLTQKQFLVIDIFDYVYLYSDNPLSQFENQNSIIEYQTAYPNPATDFVNIELSCFSDFPKIFLYNSLGNEIETEYSINDNIISVRTSNLATGIYFYKIINGNEVQTGKFVVGR